MNEILKQIILLVQKGEVVISDHGYDELAADGLFAKDAVDSIADALVVEAYPNFSKGSCVLVLQKTRKGEPMHVVWGIPKDKSTPAVLVTAYRPDISRWEPDLLRRRK